MNFPNNLKAIRENREWTLEYAAAIAGISDSYLSKLENGKRDLNARTMKKLMKAYAVTAEEIVRHGAAGLTASIADVWERIRPERRSGALTILEVIASWEGGDDGDEISIGEYEPEDKGAAKRAGSYRRETVRKQPMR